MCEESGAPLSMGEVGMMLDLTQPSGSDSLLGPARVALLSLDTEKESNSRWRDLIAQLISTESVRIEIPLNPFFKLFSSFFPSQ